MRIEFDEGTLTREKEIEERLKALSSDEKMMLLRMMIESTLGDSEIDPELKRKIIALKSRIEIGDTTTAIPCLKLGDIEQISKFDDRFGDLLTQILDEIEQQDKDTLFKSGFFINPNSSEVM